MTGSSDRERDYLHRSRNRAEDRSFTASRYDLPAPSSRGV